MTISIADPEYFIHGRVSFEYYIRPLGAPIELYIHNYFIRMLIVAFTKPNREVALTMESLFSLTAIKELGRN